MVETVLHFRGIIFHVRSKICTFLIQACSTGTGFLHNESKIKVQT